MRFIDRQFFLFFKVQTKKIPWEARDVPHDGNCLFSAVGNSVGLSARSLRAYLKEWYSKEGRTINGETVENWVKWNFNVSLPIYIETMSKNGFWGGAQELSALANALGLGIIVFEKGSDMKAKRIAEFLPDAKIEHLQAISVLWVNKSHYMQLVKT
jgi:hypothetical protein